MSSFTAKTKHPMTGKIEDAEWAEDCLDVHGYSVRFPSNPQLIYSAEIFKIERMDEPKTFKNGKMGDLVGIIKGIPPKTFRQKEEELFDATDFSEFINERDTAKYTIMVTQRLKYFLHQSHVRLLEEVEKLLPENVGLYEDLGSGFDMAVWEIKRRLEELRKEI